WQHLWRSVRRRPARTALALAAGALVCLLGAAWSYFRAAEQLARHDAEEKYQQFVQRRDEAFLYGLLAPDERALFLRAEADANLATAATAAREALALAGVDVGPTPTASTPDFPATRQAEMTADCYALLLVLAGVRGQQSLPSEGRKAQYWEALRLLDRAGQ